DFLAAAIKRSISAVVRYSRVRTEEFTVVGADRPPMRFPTDILPAFDRHRGGDWTGQCLSCFSFTLSANWCAVASTSGADAAETFPHSAASSRRSAWPTSGRRPPCERGHPCGDTAEILRTTHSNASTP